MLKEERHNKILKIVNDNGFIKNVELSKKIDTTIQTIIADINYLHSKRKLIKVYGGAKSINAEYKFKESFDEDKIKLNLDNKIKIAKKASSLIEEGDLIFIDTGTSTKQLVSFIVGKNVEIVTNGYSIAMELIEQDMSVCLVGGTIIPTTHATAGELSLKFLDNFYFDKSFIGINNVDDTGMYTTNIKEGMVKEKVIKNSKKSFILCDSSKFYKKNSIKVLKNKNVCIISDEKPSFEVEEFILA